MTVATQAIAIAEPPLPRLLLDMAKSGLSSGFGGTTTFAFGSSDLHRVPDKPFAPAQGLKTLEGKR